MLTVLDPDLALSAGVATSRWPQLTLTDRGVAQQALIGCLTDEQQLAHVTDAGLCHGWAGLVHTARRAAADADTRELATAAAVATGRARQHARDHGVPCDDGFLEGATGVLLVGAAGATTAPPTLSGWDSCLLVGG